MTDVSPWDLLQRRNYIANKEVAKKVSKERLKICKGCENFNHLAKTCGVCHCVMPFKVKLAGASCPLPIPKWKAVTNDEEMQ